MKKMVLAVLVVATLASAESPVKVETSDFWWRAVKTSVEKWFKSIEIKWDNEAAVELLDSTVDKAKEKVTEMKNSNKDSI